MYYKSLFPNRRRATRVIAALTITTSPDYDKKEYNNQIIISKFRTLPPTFAPKNWHTQWIEDLKLPMEPCHIYVDGSWTATTKTITLERHIRGDHGPKGSCAVVMIPETWDCEYPENIIKAIHITDCQDIDIDTSYGTETMANAIALAISKHRGLQEQVYTDSKSLVDTVPTLQKTKKGKRGSHKPIG